MTLTITTALPLLVAIIGLVMYFVTTNANVKRVGEIMFFAGLLSFLLTKH